MAARPVPDIPAAGQESVWNYPRPAVLQPNGRHLRVVLDGRTIAETRAGFRVVETSHPPTYYLPPADFAPGCLVPAGGGSVCEWKGAARYFDVVATGRRIPRAAWAYPDPSPAFAALRDHVAIYAGPMEACFVDGERVTPQEGAFYGGWITSQVSGPFKGAPGTQMW